MPTNITHAIPALAIGLGIGRHILPLKVIITGALIASIPDLDMIGTRYFNVPWDSIYGHRGYTHSIFFAICTALITALLFSGVVNRKHFKRYFLFFAFCMLSHGLLDFCNEGGLGVAFLWPLSDLRFHSLVQPIMNVNVSFRGLYLSTSGLPVFLSEILWVWLPFLALYLILKYKLIDQLKLNILKNKTTLK